MKLHPKDKAGWAKALRKQIESEIDSLAQSLALTDRRTFVPLTDEAIHSARKSLKKVRAGLRLLRPVGKQKRLKQANAAFRDAAHPFSEVRDAAVLVTTLGELKVADFPHAALQATLRHQHQTLRDQLLGDPKQLTAALRHELKLGRKKLQRAVQNPRSSLGDLEHSIESLYRRARSAYVDARRQKTDDAYHEARKRAKDLRYALEWSLPLYPALASKAKAAKRLTDLLGKDHDLAVLRLCLKSTHGSGSRLSKMHLQQLLTFITGRRSKLQSASRREAIRLLTETPPRFRRRLRKHRKD